MPSCRICNKPLFWKQPYKQGDRPVEKDGSIHNCSKLQNGNKDLKCIMCGGSAGCIHYEFIKECDLQAVSQLCICKKCEQEQNSFDSYKNSVMKKFPLLNLKI